MNTIYAGVGTDLYKKLDELRQEQGYLKGELDKVSVDNVYFVDPGIPEYVTGINHIERVTIEDFIRDMLLRDFTFFQYAVIESDRMIEHIDIETLSLITLPMLINLVIKCNTRVQLTYPSIKRVIEKYDVLDLNDPPEMLFEHELINIETIAFGEHKTILDYNRIENILRKLGLYERLELEHQVKSIDKKEFYERLIIRQANDNDMFKVKVNEFAYTTLTNVDDVPGMQDTNIKELPFKLSNYILYELAKGGRFDKTPVNFYLRYLEADKLYSLVKHGHTKEVFGDMLDRDILENIMTREGHFRTTTPPSIQLLNEIDPLYGYYSFSFTI